jgi:hypothetical protein
VTSNGYENVCATAPANPPHNSFAGKIKTRPPTREEYSVVVIYGNAQMP